MNLYEYQAQKLLARAGISTPPSIFAQNSHEAVLAADKIGYPCVVKAQVRMGGRDQVGGVRIVRDRDRAIAVAEEILPMTIFGHKVSGILMSKAETVISQHYVALVLDPSAGDVALLVSKQDGDDIEHIIEDDPESIKKLQIDPVEGLNHEQAVDMVQTMDLDDDLKSQLAQILLRMWTCFIDNDATLLEINPLAVIADTHDQKALKVSALDIKMSLDDNASYRHAEWSEFTDPAEVEPFAAHARLHGLRYVELEGQVGIIGNGEGLVMSSIDELNDLSNREGLDVGAANFLDIGEGASADVMEECLRVMLNSESVTTILVNIYGSMTSCSQVAEGLIRAVDKLGSSRQIVIRFSGKAAGEGLKLIEDAHKVNLHAYSNMEEAVGEAARLAVMSKEVRG